MKPIAIVYATREGQTGRIAEYLAGALKALSREVVVVDARNADAFSCGDYDAVVVAASVHAGKHEREIVDFVKQRRDALDAMPTAFLSVSLSAAGAQDEAKPPEARAKAEADVKRMIDDFFEETGFAPKTVKPVAGALAYTQYGWLIRTVMRQISKKAGGSTDTTKDHEYTDWEALDRFAAELVADLS